MTITITGKLRGMSWLLAAAIMLSLVIGANAQSKVAPAEQQRGVTTNLPIPRFVSLKGKDANVRRGPSLAHRIDWVFKHSKMPLQIVGEYGNWRRVKDRDGAGGWMHYSLLSGSRTVIILNDQTVLFLLADDRSQKIATAEEGAIAKLEDCSLNWCFIRADNAKGWVQKAFLWGVDAAEIRD